MQALLFVLFTMVANAVEYYDVNVAVPNASPGAGKIVNIVSAIPRDDTGVVESQPAQEVMSSWAAMRCVLNANKWITVRIDLDGSSWPSYPTQPTCTAVVGGVTYALRVTLIQRDWRYNDGLITNWTTGTSWTLSYGTSSSRWNQLPTWAYGYKNETTWAAKSGTSWNGARCRVSYSDNGAQHLETAISRTAAAGTGFCRVKKWTSAAKTATTNMDVPLVLSGSGR